MVPVAGLVEVTASDPETTRLMVKVSSSSSSSSSVVATVKVFVSPALPANAMAAVFSA